MYITHDNQTYANVRVYSTSGSVRFTGDSLSGVTELTGPVGVFADNGFQMQTYTPGDFLRQDIRDGSWLLTNIPLPEPQPVVVTPAEYDLTAVVGSVKRIPCRISGLDIRVNRIVVVLETFPRFTAHAEYVPGNMFSRAHDMYKAGEWAVQDGKFTKANQDTAYSLAEYPQAWDVEE